MNHFYPVDYSPSDRSDQCSYDYMALAMAYVPWQQFKNTYEPEKALATGTIFPELDKPFLGKRGTCL